MKKPLPLSKLIDIGWVLAVAVLSSLLAYSQWREASPFDSPDIRAHQANAIEFIRNGVIPYRGQGLSYSGYGPPGTSFLMIPGVLLMKDPRLAEVPGAVLLHFGTLLFLFLVVRDWIGRGAAWAVVPLAGFLPFTGPTLWPNGHPFFVAGMLYCLMRWVRGRSAHWFSAALLLSGLGMYVYFTLAPALIAMAVIAVAYRRPFSLRSITVVSAFLFLIWLPYLHFEAGRGFVDIGNMLLRRDPAAAESQSAPTLACYATLPGEADFREWTYIPWTASADLDKVIFSGAGRKAQIEHQLCLLLNRLDRNFDSDYFLFGVPAWPTAILFGLCIAGTAALLFRSATGWKRIAGWAERLRAVPAWKFLLAAGIGAAAVFLLVRPAVVGTIAAGDPDWDLPSRLLLAQLRAFGIVIWIALAAGALLASRWDLPAREAGVPAAMITVCGILLWVLSETDRSWRFYWFWSMQCVGVAAAIGALIRAWRIPRPLSAAIIAVTVTAFFPVRPAAEETNAVRLYGYGGRESGQIEALEWLAETARREPDRTFSIGVARYQNDNDPVRAWGWLEFGLHYLLEVPNAAASGPLPDDDFRVVEFLGDDLDRHPSGCPWEGYAVVWESRRYMICQLRP